MSIADEDRLLENAVLTMILDLHPEHLTTAELVLKMTWKEGHAEGEAIRQAICDLTGSSLLRRAGDVVEPTHAAVRAGELLAWP